jgi:integrase
VTIDHALREVKAFFSWLADRPGCKSRIRHAEVEYFNPPKRTANSARGTVWQPHASPQQLRHVLAMMPTASDMARRDRAVVAFLFLTGCRDGAAAIVRLANVDLDAGCVHFKGPEIETKFGKVFTTWFLPVGDGVRGILADWARELRNDHLWGPDDPLFPRTKVGPGSEQRFQPLGLDRAPWSNGRRICKIYQEAFSAAGLPRFPAHSIRHTLSELGMQACDTIEEMKAWSQNIGHDDILTTLRSYGTVAPGRQAELLRRMAGREQV